VLFELLYSLVLFESVVFSTLTKKMIEINSVLFIFIKLLH